MHNRDGRRLRACTLSVSPKTATITGVTADISRPPRALAAATLDESRAVLADGAAAVDPALAQRIRTAPRWRTQFVALMGELTALSSVSRKSSLAIARAGLDSAASTLSFSRDGATYPLHDALTSCPPRDDVTTQRITGTAHPPTELEIPYHGRLLRRASLLSQLESWVEKGIIEPGVAVAIERVAAHPEWLSLPGHQVVCLGAGAGVGPMQTLTSWGATVLAVETPHHPAWPAILDAAQAGAGTVSIPVRGDTPGLDATTDLPELLAWINGAADPGPLTIGTFSRAEPETHFHHTAAQDAVAANLVATRPDTTLAYLANALDAYVIDDSIAAAAMAAYRRRPAARLGHWLTGTLAFRPAHSAQPHIQGASPITNTLVALQHPNIIAAQRLQRWRALVTADSGHTVSFNVLPLAWNPAAFGSRAAAAAHAGAPYFGAEVFDADTSRTLMTALLVHDLHQPAPASTLTPEALFIRQAVHGGLWRSGYDNRSVLPLAVALGMFKVGRIRQERQRYLD